MCDTRSRTLEVWHSYINSYVQIDGISKDLNDFARKEERGDAGGGRRTKEKARTRKGYVRYKIETSIELLFLFFSVSFFSFSFSILVTKRETDAFVYPF